MRKHTLIATLFAAMLSGGVLAQGGTPPAAAEEPIFGSQMMTQQERIEHRDKMRAAKTLEEREQVRSEHHKRMVERAKERGVTLPDEPPARGGAMMGPGGGRGYGGGMGPGARPDSRPGY
ncbi:hypothetical protein CJ010_17120 [Azoarcus sp. DD4]|uniref:hypothetical protein n=1 Tax=Azoarcus sp. DD4 TaxID=2027405 RepID=UPI00112B400B|nr:hypothetical protein [Azoarcus sp. DD4]QDF98137.1 hypothetical protein CJ010_17120 [Azoarcus sp. DD4]